MKFEVRRESPVEPEQRSDGYYIQVHSMIGDADGYVDNEIYCETVEELEKYIGMFVRLCCLHWNAMCDDYTVRSVIMEYAEQKGYDHEELIDQYTQTVEHHPGIDILNHPMQIWVLEQDGVIQHNISMVINGKEYYQLTRDNDELRLTMSFGQ